MGYGYCDGNDGWINGFRRGSAFLRPFTSSTSLVLLYSHFCFLVYVIIAFSHLQDTHCRKSWLPVIRDSLVQGALDALFLMLCCSDIEPYYKCCTSIQ